MHDFFNNQSILEYFENTNRCDSEVFLVFHYLLRFSNYFYCPNSKYAVIVFKLQNLECMTIEAGKIMN